MACARPMGNDAPGPVAERRRRESGATLYILVQIQAGSPAFAREAREGCRAEAVGEGGLVSASFGSASQRQAPKHAKSRLMAPLKPFRGCKIWSKDPRARGYAALLVDGDARHARPFFVPNFREI